MAQDKTKLVDSGDMQRNLTKMAAAVPEAVDRLLGKVAMAVVADAKRRAPYDQGSLRAAVAAKWHGGEQAPEAGPEAPEPFTEQARPGEAIAYDSMRYAAAVHENLEAQHDHGEAKFLENAILEVGREELLKKLQGELLKEIAP